MKTDFVFLFVLASLLFSTGCIGEKTSYAENAGQGYNRYYDTMGGFSIEYPDSWTYDDTISIVSEGYNVVFTDPDTGARMGIFSEPLGSRDFDELARRELAPPEEMSAVFNSNSFGNFRAYENFYEYEMDGDIYYGEGVMFTDNLLVFGISYTCKIDELPELHSTFEHMKNSFRIES